MHYGIALRLNHHGYSIYARYGFFVAGIMAGQSPALPERTRQIISQMVNALFVPLFFTNIGLKIDFVGGFNLLLCSLFLIIGFGGRFLGAWAGVAFTKVPQTNRLSIALDAYARRSNGDRAWHYCP